ncbi:uncharacterized protein LOC126295950 [Schistocerca gregaria]|uniref:uncharacterized protein LOC126295950 n=1 Tax=Schistocerca gregaria TaxID=7010 RepID=UPI00211F0157|nr:uncharacterized protein LOC126295950 [Schistocerca gregaria]
MSETALEARRREAQEAHSEAGELRRQLALVQGCAALRGHWLGAGAAGSLSSREPSAEDEQLHGREAAPQGLTSWSQLAAAEAPPTQQAEGLGEPRQSPPPSSTGTRSTDSLERGSMAGEDRLRSLEEGNELQRARPGDAGRLSPSGQVGGAGEGFYLQNAQNQEEWGQLNVNRDTRSADRGQGSLVADDDDDVITENANNTETVGNSPGTFSESKSQSWHSTYGNKEASGRFRRIDALRSPRSQVVHHVVDIEPDFSSDFRRRVPRRRSRFGMGVDRIGEETGYPLNYSVPSQQISSFTYSNEGGNQSWPASYTERNLDNAEITQDVVTWGITDIKGSVFDKVRDPEAPRSPRSSGTRARTTKSRSVRAKKTWSKPSDAGKLSSDTSSVESPERKPAGASYYDRMAQRMGGDLRAVPTGDQRPTGQPAWSLSPVHGEEGRGVRKTAWRRVRAKARGSLSEQTASELEEIDRRRQLRQLQHLETTRE